MSAWSKQKVDESTINGGQEYTANDRVSLQNLNSIVNNSLYAADNADFATRNSQEAKNIAQQALDQTTADGINPNLLINGDFRVNQRGLSSYTTASKYCADRWIFRGAGSAAPSISNEITITASTTNTLTGIFQNFDKNDAIKLLGKTVTLSVKVSSITLTTKVFRCAVSYSDYSATAVGTVVGKVDVPSNAAGVYSVTMAIPSNIDLDTNIFKVGLFFMGPTANDNATIEWAKLEIGSSATTFSPKTFAEELSACQRYFIKVKLHGLAASAYSATKFYPFLSLPVTLRTSPTISITITTAPKLRGQGSNNLGTVSNITIQNTNSNGCTLSATTSGLTTGYFYELADGEATLDSEIY